eukprot:834487-Pyramimonas_sp.AAC.1
MSTRGGADGCRSWRDLQGTPYICRALGRLTGSAPPRSSRGPQLQIARVSSRSGPPRVYPCGANEKKNKMS